MPVPKASFTKDTFRFFRELERNNHKPWMDENRHRYREYIVQPCRRFLEDLAPALLQLNPEFDVTGKTGANFSRINRDIRFAKDKTPYKTQMYVKVQCPRPDGSETGQLYVGLSTKTVTVGFRIYSGEKRKTSALALLAEPRVSASPKWVVQQKKRLSRNYESYWYATVKGEWTKHEGWPADAEDWKRIRAWIVRKKLSPAAALRPDFQKQILKVFKDLYPLLKFTAIPD